jgi:hypothetical protein
MCFLCNKCGEFVHVSIIVVLVICPFFILAKCDIEYKINHSKSNITVIIINKLKHFLSTDHVDCGQILI